MLRGLPLLSVHVLPVLSTDGLWDLLPEASAVRHFLKKKVRISTAAISSLYLIETKLYIDLDFIYMYIHMSIKSTVTVKMLGRIGKRFVLFSKS